MLFLSIVLEKDRELEQRYLSRSISAGCGRTGLIARQFFYGAENPHYIYKPRRHAGDFVGRRRHRLYTSCCRPRRRAMQRRARVIIMIQFCRITPLASRDITMGKSQERLERLLAYIIFRIWDVPCPIIHCKKERRILSPKIYKYIYIWPYYSK